MIHVDMGLPDGTKAYFLLNELTDVGKILPILSDLIGDESAKDGELFDELSGRKLQKNLSLKAQGITSGYRLRIGAKGGQYASVQ